MPCSATWSTSATTDPRTRQLGDERARYSRKAPGEQVDDLRSWFAAHRVFSVAAVAFLAVGAILWAARGSQVAVADLVAGDCLYIGAVADPTSVRPVGEPHDAAGALWLSGAERASCDASHGHEVSAIVMPAIPSRAPGELGQLLDHNQMESMAEPHCDAAFAGYVGRPLEGSRYLTFPVVPDSDGAAAWVAGGMRTVCLVARADGQWMDHPARGSGE